METKSIEVLIQELKEITNDCITGDLSINDLPGYVLGYLDTINNEIQTAKEIVTDLVKSNIEQTAQIAELQTQVDFWKKETDRQNEHINTMISIIERLTE